MRKFTASFLILFCLATTCAAPNPDELSKKFLGAWRQVSIEGNPPGRTNVYDRPTGLIMYDPSGHMSVNIVFKAYRKPFAPYTKGLLSASMPRPVPSPTTSQTISSPAAKAPSGEPRNAYPARISPAPPDLRRGRTLVRCASSTLREPLARESPFAERRLRADSAIVEACHPKRPHTCPFAA